MNKINKSNLTAKFVALSLLFLILFLPPALLLFNVNSSLGFSYLPLYIFISWLLVIVLLAWLVETHL